MRFAHAHRAPTGVLALVMFSILSISPAFAAAPRIIGVPNTTVTAGDNWSFQPAARDADDNTLTFSVVNAPPFAHLSPTTGKISGVPHSAQARTYSNIVISVTDGTSTVSLPAFTLVVKSGTNEPPPMADTPPSTPAAADAAPIEPEDDVQPIEGDADEDPLTPVSEGAGAATGAVTLSWTPPMVNMDGSALTNLAGYRIVYGKSEGALTEMVEVANPGISSYVVENLTGGTWYFGLKTYNANGSEGPLSGIVSKLVQ